WRGERTPDERLDGANISFGGRSKTLRVIGIDLRVDLQVRTGVRDLARVQVAEVHDVADHLAALGRAVRRRDDAEAEDRCRASRLAGTPVAARQVGRHGVA